MPHLFLVDHYLIFPSNFCHIYFLCLSHLSFATSCFILFFVSLFSFSCSHTCKNSLVEHKNNKRKIWFKYKLFLLLLLFSPNVLKLGNGYNHISSSFCIWLYIVNEFFAAGCLTDFALLSSSTFNPSHPLFSSLFLRSFITRFSLSPCSHAHSEQSKR